MSLGYAFTVGDYVEKWTGDAQYRGWIVSRYRTRKRLVRYVVEIDPQRFQMIVSEGQIRLCDY